MKQSVTRVSNRLRAVCETHDTAAMDDAAEAYEVALDRRHRDQVNRGKVSRMMRQRRSGKPVQP